MTTELTNPHIKLMKNQEMINKRKKSIRKNHNELAKVEVPPHEENDDEEGSYEIDNSED